MLKIHVRTKQQQIPRQKCLFSTHSVLHSLTLAQSYSHFESVFAVIALCGHLLLQKWTVIKLPQQLRPGSPFSLNHNECTHTPSYPQFAEALGHSQTLIRKSHCRDFNPAPPTVTLTPYSTHLLHYWTQTVLFLSWNWKKLLLFLNVKTVCNSI